MTRDARNSARRLPRSPRYERPQEPAVQHAFRYSELHGAELGQAPGFEFENGLAKVLPRELRVGHRSSAFERAPEQAGEFLGLTVNPFLEAGEIAFECVQAVC